MKSAFNLSFNGLRLSRYWRFCTNFYWSFFACFHWVVRLNWSWSIMGKTGLSAGGSPFLTSPKMPLPCMRTPRQNRCASGMQNTTAATSLLLYQCRTNERMSQYRAQPNSNIASSFCWGFSMCRIQECRWCTIQRYWICGDSAASQVACNFEARQWRIQN